MQVIIETSDIQCALNNIKDFEPHGFDTLVFLEYLIDTLIEAPDLHEDSLVSSVFDMEMLGQPVGDITDVYAAAHPHLVYVIRSIRYNIQALLKRLPHARAHCRTSGWSGTAFVFSLGP